VETVKKIVNGFLGALAGIQKTLAVAICLIIPVIIVVQVFMRYVLKVPLMGIEELLTFFIIWLYMLGGGVASCERTHISCGILTLYMKKPMTIKIFNICKAFFGCVCGAWIARWGWWYITYSAKLGKVSDLLHIPMVIGEGAIFVGFILMLIFSIVELVDAVKDLNAYVKEAKA
jgi:TRAP-type C4-dicarboxylate transport system permease small subunit